MFFLLYFAHLMRESRGIEKEPFFFSLTTVAVLPVNEHSLDFFKLKTHLHKAAPDMSTLDGGGRKIFTQRCWLPPWVTPWMSAPHYREKNDALYSGCMGPFIDVSLATDSMYGQLRFSGTELVLIHSL